MTMVFSMMMRISRWCNLVFLSVGVLLSVFTLVMVSWSVVGVDWLSVRVVVHIDDWVMVVRFWVGRITSWVSVYGLVLMVNSLVVDWLNLVCCVVLKIVVIVVATMSVVVINILEFNLVVVSH